MAQLPVGDDPSKVNIPALSADTVFENILNLVYFGTGVIAVIVLVIAGYMYATARGNTEKTSNARRLILYSLSGIIVVIAAFAITGFITGRLGT